MSNGLHRVSVIIPTHNRTDKLLKVLEGIESQSYPHDLIQLFIVDDGSPVDPTPAISKLNSSCELELLRLPRGGPAKARNRALERATGEYVLFLNDDVLLADDLVETHVNTHSSLGEPVSVLGAFRFGLEQREDLFCRILEDFGFTHTKQFRSETFLSYQAFWTANLSVPRAAMEFVGNFCEDFPEPCTEDIELGYRLEQRLSMRLFFTDRARCLHDHFHDLEMWRRRDRMVGRNSWRMYQRHGVGATLTGLKENGKLSPTKVRAVLQELEARAPRAEATVKTLELLLGMGPEAPPLEGSIELIQGQRFILPRQRDLAIDALLEQLGQYDQQLGLLRAIEEGLGGDTGVP